MVKSSYGGWDRHDASPHLGSIGQLRIVGLGTRTVGSQAALGPPFPVDTARGLSRTLAN
jgi:hypothetical protein